jgi:hypothetical protein
MNEKYHFEDQIRQRYDSELYDLIVQTFVLLPLCTLIEHKVLVLHGNHFHRFIVGSHSSFVLFTFISINSCFIFLFWN